MPRRRTHVLQDGRPVITAALLLLTCASCTQLKGIPSPDINAQQLVGHQVRVTTVDGRILQFKLATVTDDALVGLPESRVVRNRVVLVTEQVRFDEIALLERYEFSVGKTVGVVSGIATGLLLLFLWGLSQVEI